MYGLRRKGLGGDCGTVNVDGRAHTTVCISYADYNLSGHLYDVSGAQSQGYAVRIYDPSGILPNIDFDPKSNTTDVLQAAGMPLSSGNPSGGADLDYAQTYAAQFSNVVSGAQTPEQLQESVVQQMLNAGWSQQQMSPWINTLPAGSSLTTEGGAVIAPTQPVYQAPAQSVAPSTYSPAALSAPTGILTSPPVADPSAQTPSTYYTAPALASSESSGVPAVSATPAISNTVLLGGLAVVGILIMMSMGGKS
jgi:hypothetical protein